MELQSPELQSPELQSPEGQLTPSNGWTTAPPTLSLSELVERTGVPASTIHHYRRLGLIPPPPRPAANRFGYDERHVEALRLIRLLRERRGLSLEQIAVALPDLLGRDGAEGIRRWSEAGEEPPDARHRIMLAAIAAFETRNYGEVAMSDIAEAAGVSKGSVYRHFASKEDVFTAAVECLLADTSTRFAAAVGRLGGADGVAGDSERTAVVFAGLVARVLPLLMELGARAAKGHEPSVQLARRALRTLADAAGGPLVEDPAGAIPAGLELIEHAFATVLGWAVGPDWPPDTMRSDTVHPDTVHPDRRPDDPTTRTPGASDSTS